MVKDADLLAGRLMTQEPDQLKLYSLPVSIKESLEIKVSLTYI